MISQDQLKGLTGATAYDRSGDKIGKVGAVYYDDRTDQPTWVTVHTGLFGTSETFVPVQGAEYDGGDKVTLAYEKAVVKGAPNISEDGHLTPQEEEQLYRHYGIDYGSNYGTGTGTGYGESGGRGTVESAELGTTTTTTGTARHALGDRDVVGRDTDRDLVDRDRDRDGIRDDVEGRTVGRDTSGPTTDDAMTRSEEQLRVGTQTQEAGRARLRKHVVTEHQQVSVPVTHEEVTLEREPITEANRGAAYDGPAISEEEHEVTLHAERPVVDTEAVAVERVRLGKETVTDRETVGGEVRKEEIELDRGDTVRDELRDDVRTDRR
jgi:uncharacterized protein (TIGR02271 family)